MADKSTWVKMDRNIVNWRWYKDANTMRLFFHLILKANVDSHDFENITVARGQLVTSYPSLSKELGLSIRSVRTSLNHLKSTGEVTVTTYSKFSVISILCYDKYQKTDRQSDSHPTGNRQSTDSQSTPIKEYKNDNNGKNDLYKGAPPIKQMDGFTHVKRVRGGDWYINDANGDKHYEPW